MLPPQHRNPDIGVAKGQQIGPKSIHLGLDHHQGAALDQAGVLLINHIAPGSRTLAPSA